MTHRAGPRLRDSVGPRIFFALVPILLIALPMFFIGQNMNRLGDALGRDGQRIEAAVTALWTETRDVSSTAVSQTSTHYWVEYTFVPPGGGMIRDRSEIPLRAWVRLRDPGQNGAGDAALPDATLPVVFLPDDPDVNAPEAANWSRDGLLLQAGAGGIALLGALPLIGAYRIWRRELAWRRRRG